jgi:hypothetical protein
MQSGVFLGIGLVGLLALLWFMAIWFGPPKEVEVQESDNAYVAFSPPHIKKHYNLEFEDLCRIQVWNYGEIHAVSVGVSTESTGEVRDGKPVAQNATTEVRKSVRIPHLTPGVIILAVPGEVYVDFGEATIQFDDYDSCGLSNSQFRDYYARDKVARDKIVPKEEGFARACLSDNPRFRWQNTIGFSPFLVYRGGGSLTNRRKVETLPETRATGRTIE